MTTIDKEELTELIKQYWGDESTANYCVKHYKYVKLGDRFVEVGNAKPTIDTTIYYDDETEAPKITLETFIKYNMSKLPSPAVLTDAYFGEVRNLYITPAHVNDTTGGKLAAISMLSDKDLLGRQPYELVTEDQLERIQEARNEIKADFEKRLTSYWKRYQNKIQTAGYWANR